MPYMISEPQRVEGTSLGFAVYPYYFSFEDHIDFSDKHDKKLVVFKLKDTKFVEVEKTLHEERFQGEEVRRGFVDRFMQKFLDDNPMYVTDQNKLDAYMSEHKVYGEKTLV